jgi:hypothetical protein
MKIRFISIILLSLFARMLPAQDSIKTVDLKHWKDHVLYDDSLYAKQISNKNLIKKGMEKKLAVFLFLYFNPTLKETYEKNPTFYKRQIEFMMEPPIHDVHAGHVIWDVMFPSNRFGKNGWNSFDKYILLSEIEPFLKD